MIKESFKEFMTLYYTKPGNRLNNSKDVYLDLGIIARLESSNCTIHYLSNGNRIVIPWDYMDLFSSLDTYNGSKIRNDYRSQVDDIDDVIYSFLNLVLLLFKKNGKLFLDLLADLCCSKEKIAKFRKWYNKEFNKNLGVIEIYSLDKNLKI